MRHHYRDKMKCWSLNWDLFSKINQNQSILTKDAAVAVAEKIKGTKRQRDHNWICHWLSHYFRWSERWRHSVTPVEKYLSKIADAVFHEKLSTRFILNWEEIRDPSFACKSTVVGERELNQNSEIAVNINQHTIFHSFHSEISSAWHFLLYSHGMEHEHFPEICWKTYERAAFSNNLRTEEMFPLDGNRFTWLDAFQATRDSRSVLNIGDLNLTYIKFECERNVQEFFFSGESHRHAEWCNHRVFEYRVKVL